MPQDPVTFTSTERLILAAVRGVNHHPRLKGWSHAFLRSIGAAWVHLVTGNLLQVTDGQIVERLAPDRGVVFASNHRSYGDQFVLSSVLLRTCRWVERFYFPVRNDYFYERVGGLILNTVLTGMAMYPPVYRQAARRPLNREMVAFIAEQLRRPGTVVGLHPEGRRSTAPDPYTLLPAQPGIGEIVQRAQPIVIPVFINGVADNPLSVVRANFGPAPRPPITVTFGAPMDLSGFADAPAGPRTSLRIAQAIRAEIERLGARDRARRAGGGGTPALN